MHAVGSTTTPTAGAIALAAMLIFFAVSAAGVARATAVSVDATEAESYSEAHDVPPETAEARLELQQRAAAIVGQLQAALGDEYAGVWFDNQAGEFVIPVLTGPGAGRIRAEIVKVAARDEIGDAFRFGSAQYSWSDLEAAQDRLNASLRALILKGLAKTSIDPETNSVAVGEARFAALGGAAELHRKVEREGDAAVVEPEAEAVFGALPQTCAFDERRCSRPLRGGVRIVNGVNQPDSECTAGFKAVGKELGNRFLLTAGHCVWEPVAGLKTEVFEAGSGYQAWERVGVVGSAWSYPGNDYAAIRANGTYWDTEYNGANQPWPSEVANWGENQDHPILYEGWSYKGQWVCHVGVGGKVAKSCGAVGNLEHTIKNEKKKPNGEIVVFPVYHGIEFGTVAQPICSAGGDSGGPVFAGNTALGIFVSSSGSANETPQEEAANECQRRGYYTSIIENTNLLAVSVGTRLGGAPLAGTEAATELTPYSAQLNGTINPAGVPTEWWFDWGPTPAYGSSTGVGQGGSGTNYKGVAAPILGLQPATTYHYQLVARNAVGTTYGGNRTVTTPPAPPIVTMNAPSAITTNGVTFSGTVNPQGADTRYRFEYGPTAAYGKSIPVEAPSVGSGLQAVPISVTVSGLSAETTYHARLSAWNSAGSRDTADRAFSTKAHPPSFVAEIGSFGTAKRQYNRPTAIAVDQFQNVWAVDSGNHRVAQLYTEGSGEFDRSFTYGTHDFGSLGSGNGQLNSPRGLAVEPSGTGLYVADTGNDRVQKFNIYGEYLSQFGSSGTAAGQFVEPVAVAVAPSGDVWVADAGAHRIVQFSKAGQFVREVRHLLLRPQGIAVDASGNVWVADTGNNRIRIFNSSGAPLAEFGAAGSGPGQFKEPVGLAFKRTGNLFVADRGNNRVQQFSPQGEFLAQFGAAGSGAGQLLEPLGVATARAGNLYVADTSNHRLQRWRQAGPLEAFLSGGVTFPGPTRARLQGGVYPNGAASTYQLEWGLAGKPFENVTPVPPQNVGAGPDPVPLTLEISGLSPNTSYHARLVASSSEGSVTTPEVLLGTPDWPPEVATGGVSNLSTTGATLHGSVNPAGTPTRFNFEWGRNAESYSNATSMVSIGSGVSSQAVSAAIAGLTPETVYHYRVHADNQRGADSYGSDRTFITPAGEPVMKSAFSFPDPAGIATETGGYLLVAYPKGNSVMEMTATGGVITQIGVGQMLSPQDVAADLTGIPEAVVADTGNNRIQRFRTWFGGGAFVSQFGVKGTGNGQFSEPRSVAIGPKSEIVVADTANHRIQVFNEAGGFIAQIRGPVGNELLRPEGVAVDSAGRIYVADTGKNRVALFSSTGQLLGTFGSGGTGPGQLLNPRGIEVKASGNVFVADSGNNRVSVFTSGGKYLFAFGTKLGTNPIGIAFAENGDAFVTFGSGTIQRWGY
jgi:DNA-binding beta-propeller fold protein YncE